MTKNQTIENMVICSYCTVVFYYLLIYHVGTAINQKHNIKQSSCEYEVHVMVFFKNTWCASACMSRCSLSAHHYQYHQATRSLWTKSQCNNEKASCASFQLQLIPTEDQQILQVYLLLAHRWPNFLIHGTHWWRWGH